MRQRAVASWRRPCELELEAEEEAGRDVRDRRRDVAACDAGELKNAHNSRELDR
jgi:hypothetical protein